MKNPFTTHLHAQIAQLNTSLGAVTKERDAAREKLAAVEPDIEQRANDRAIDLIASAGVSGPISCGEGKAGAGGAPRTKEEFVAAYQRIEDPAESSAYFEQHKALLN
jgi:hypothetical protein